MLVLVWVRRMVDMVVVVVGVEVLQPPRNRLLLRIQAAIGRLVQRVQSVWVQRQHRRRRLLHDGAQCSVLL